MQGDLVFYVKLELKPECVSEWKAAVTTVIELMSRESAFVSCSLQQDANDPLSYTLYERWREPSVEAFVKNQFEGKDYRQAYETRLPRWLRARGQLVSFGTSRNGAGSESLDRRRPGNAGGSQSPGRRLRPNPRMQPTGRTGAERRSGGALRLKTLS